MNEGFFPELQIKQNKGIKGRSLGCISCGLNMQAKSPKMPPFGNFKLGILNIGEAPGEVEDNRGKPFQGKTGKLLQRTYEDLGVDLFADCLNINACNCRPIDADGNNRTPTNFEVDCCRKNILQVIDDYKPKVIILLGNAAVYSIIGHRWKKDLGGITKWRGFAIPDQDFGAWICPTFHPSYVERAEDYKDIEVIWQQDLVQAFEKVKQPLPKHNEPAVEIINDLSILSTIKDRCAIDFETTGLKPHAAGQRIICCAIADSAAHCYAFVMPQTRQERKPLIQLLADPRIEKMSHNMKFEEAWSTVRLHQPVNNWYWDSMLAAHILDNREGTTSLKFQVYVQFGIVDYASEIQQYLEADRKNANSINTIDALLSKLGGKEKLLKYCGYDAVYEYRLATKQIELMDADLPF